MSKKIITKVEYCVQCPKIKNCKVFNKLSKEAQFFMKLSPSAPKILANCPLEND